MSNPWFRMYAEFLHDPKVQMLSEADQRRYIMLLCIRCSNDYVTLQDEEVTFLLRICHEEWQRTKLALQQRMLIDANNLPTGWDRRQYASDSSAARVRKHRAMANGKCNVTVTPPDTDTDTDTESEKTKTLLHDLPLPSDGKLANATSLANGFERFWAAYPKRKNRGLAEKAWLKIKPDAGLVAVILQAVEAAKAGGDWQKDAGQFIPYPATWLNARGWEDDVKAAAYVPEEIDVFAHYRDVLGRAGWPDAAVEPFSPERAASIREFLTFSQKPGWVAAYFAWLADSLPPKPGCGFDWAIKRDTYLRAREGNFAALKDAA